jgi:transposase-like protein
MVKASQKLAKSKRIQFLLRNTCVIPVCKKCGSYSTEKKRTKNPQQIYFCKSCQKEFLFYDYHDLPKVSDVRYKKNKSKILKMRSQGKSTAEIEKLMGVNKNIIYRNMVLDREIIPSEYIFSILMSEILLMFNNGESLRSIGRFYGVSGSVITSNLEKIGAHKIIPFVKYETNDNYFSNMNTEKQFYWLGWIYSDGSIAKMHYSYSIKLQLSIKQKEIVEDFHADIDTNKPVTYPEVSLYQKKFKTASMEIYSKQMFDDLMALGVTPKKSLTLEHPSDEIIPDKFFPAFLLGYIEGDGSPYLNIKKNSMALRMTILGTKDICLWLKEKISKIYGVELIVVYPHKGIYQVTINNGGDVSIILSDLYDRINSKMVYKKDKMIKFLKWFKDHKTFHIRGNDRNRYKDDQMKKLDYVIKRYNY